MNETVNRHPINAASQVARSAPHAWAPLDSLRQEIDRLFEDFHPLWRFPASHASGRSSLFSNPEWSMTPAVDMVEKSNQYEITAELAGLDDKDVELMLASGTLTIKGEKSEDRHEQKDAYHLSERRYGAFQRSFRLPDGIDADRIEAKFEKGLLRVVLPKTSEAVKGEKKIEIKAA